ncbi:MAG: hypothetical protein K0Q73_6017 [Paenibacillus sp.]|nr:hypothetical protein [Paenibacillus sp.]
MVKITIASQHPVLSFASEEWSRLLNISGASMTEQLDEVWIGTWEQLKVWQPALMKMKDGSTWRDLGYSDEFVVMEMHNQIVLSGKSERAALYAVYQYAQEMWGLHAIYPGAGATITSSKSSSSGNPMQAAKPIRWYAPRLERRGFVFETINDPLYLKELLDWFAQNKINEIFFTFKLWDQVGDEIASEIIKRGITVTLGGHSMKFFLNKEDHLRVTEAEHPYTAKAQLNFQDSDWQAPLMRDIAQYCRHVPNLTRLSLWPEDIADRETEQFLMHYLQFTEQLNKYLQECGLDIAVEHIAYNAGLAWNMLERNGAKPSAEVDTLFAFWGRDYRFGYEDRAHESDRRAKEAIEDWTHELKRTERKLTVFEYYSDHYMLSNLFPFLPQRILKDVAYYEQLQILGMVNLVVPYRGPDPYPWKWVHGFNSYVFCRALWNANLEEILNDYYAFYPDSESAAVRALFEVMEVKLSGLTYWNTPLFPARAVDPEKANASSKQKESILAVLEDIKISMQDVLQQQTELSPDSMPHLYAQHIIKYSENLYHRWLEQ